MTTPPVADRINTVQDVADRLHVHVQTVRKWIKDGDLGHIAVGRYKHVSDAQLAEFIARRRIDAG